jgi:hypothetical protein
VCAMGIQVCAGTPATKAIVWERARVLIARKAVRNLPAVTPVAQLIARLTHRAQPPHALESEEVRLFESSFQRRVPRRDDRMPVGREHLRMMAWMSMESSVSAIRCTRTASSRGGRQCPTVRMGSRVVSIGA